ncbi:MAG: helix-turn-helix domain-containing protein [Steroidobacteraceae bacterium]|nr:helix-turn-helix domain-containing protein [Steroidobacteraceae bacterium]
MSGDAGVVSVPAGIVKSAARAFEIIEIFAREQRPLHAREIQLALDIPASSTIALVKSLMHLGYLRFDRRARLYVPTLRVAMLGDWLRRDALASEGVLAAMRMLSSTTGETAFLSTPNDVHMQVTHIVPGREAVALAAKPGMLVSMTESAVGIAFLASRPDDEIGALCRRLEREHHRAGPIDFAALMARVAAARRRKYAAAYGLLPGVGSVAAVLPAPLDTAQVVLCIGGAEARVREREHEYGRDVLAAIRRYRARLRSAGPAIRL